MNTMDNSRIEELQKPVTDLRCTFIKLTSPYRESLWKYCLKITGNAVDAEDLLQDTLLRAFAKLGYLGQALNLKAYLFKMATNIWIRQQARKRLLESDDYLDWQQESAENELSHELGEMMEWLVELLPPKQRVAFILSSSFDFGNKEIAELMGTSEGTIKSYLHRARKIVAGAVANGIATKKKTILHGEAEDQVIDRYIQAFNKADVKGLLSLLDENATTCIIGDWEEYGKGQIEANSLHFWSLESSDRFAVYGELDDIPVIFGFRKNEEGKTALREVIRLSHDGRLIHSVDWYFFAVDFIKYAAEKLNVPYIVQGYQYEAEPDTGAVL
ncbi:MAG: RNA polymerase sigma factor [Cyclobacteriaceae bacterium]|nr:RNA polymerase sigma factor [Cyclobacteriaceae bacterium]